MRDQVARIVKSRLFAQAPMLCRLLEYIVEHSLEAPGESLKEYAIGVDVFNRGPSFDPRLDTIVRVQARRLRSKLEEYYHNEGSTDPVAIRLPKGSYIVRYETTVQDVPPQTATAPPHDDASASIGQARGSATAAPSVVVLPFTNLGGKPDDEYFGDGLTEELINGLASVSGLLVVARTSAFQYKGRAGDIRDIGHDLGVRWAVEGSVRTEGRRARIIAQMIDVESGFHLWSHAYDREMSDAFAIQEDITHAILHALRPHLAPLERTRPDAPHVPSTEAYESYLWGRYFYNKITAAALERSAEFMLKAIACDPGFAAPHAGLADAYLMWMSLVAQRPREELLAKSRESAATAVELDGSSAEGHCALAQVLAIADWDFAAAEGEFARAIELRPSFAHARMLYSVTCLSPQQRHEEAIDQIRQALRVDPASLLLRTMLAQAQIVAGSYDVAVEALGQVLDVAPEFDFARYTLALAYLGKSLPSEVLRVLVDAPSSDRGSNFLGHLGYAQARLGNDGAAREVLHELLARPWAPGIDAAAIHNGLGETREAFRWLQRAVDGREFDAMFIRDDPRFRNLHSDERWRVLVSRSGAPSARPR